MDIGKNIKKLRELKNFSQNYMAKELGVSQKTYSNIESDGNNITIGKLEEIAAILETTKSHIIDLETKMSFDPLFPLAKKHSRTLHHFENRAELSYSTTLNDELIQSKNDLIDYLKNELSILKLSAMESNSNAIGKSKKVVKLRIG